MGMNDISKENMLKLTLIFAYLKTAEKAPNYLINEDGNQEGLQSDHDGLVTT